MKDLRRLKVLIILLLGIAFQNVSLCQHNRLDSIINDYDRIYRIELNNSDSILIRSYLEILNKDCKELNNYLESKKYSGSFKAEIVKELIFEGNCTTEIFENIEMEQYSSNSMRPYECINFPLMNLLQDSILKNELFMKISKEQSLCKASESKHKSFLNKHYKKGFLHCYRERNKEKLSKCEKEYMRLFEE